VGIEGHEPTADIMSAGRTARDQAGPDRAAQAGPDGAAKVGPEGAAQLDAEHITTSTRDPVETAGALGEWLVGKVGTGGPVSVTAVSSPASNGMSSETLLFTAGWSEDGAPVERRMVARIEPPAADYPVFTTYDLDMQFRVMHLVRTATTVPVPETLWYEGDPSVLGGPFFVMERIDGSVPPDVLPYTFGDNWVFDATATDRRTLQESAVAALVGIHSVTPDRHDLGFLQLDAPGSTSLARCLSHWRRYHDWVVRDRPSSLLADCFAWLADTQPAEVGSDALSWGDSRIGNMMFRDHRVVAVFDWEMAAVAPPEVDIGWMCYLHLFFQDLATQLGAPGLPDMFRPAEVAVAYAARSGRTLGDLTWYIAFAAMRHGVIMRRVTERSIHFGETDEPEDVDDLIIHRDTLRAMLDGSYWSRIAL
jgi:aminoglycoside phosphotransferase (APT) family kinase protein